MYRYARTLAGQPVDPNAKYSRLLPFAQRLKRARVGRDMTAKTMAWRTGMGIRNYHMIERAVRNPRLLSVIEMARALGLTVGQLVDGDRTGVGGIWADVLSDPAEDIYTLEDGQPTKR
jgi:transcriptional regulator with XRE-family HTH domain